MAGFDLNSLLNGKSKGAAVQAQEQTAAGPAEQENAFEVVMLDVEDLMPSKDNFYSTENIEELALSIELAGCIEQNLVVKPEAHGKYEVIAGHRRRLAALKLVADGKEEYRKVPCRIKKESDEIKDRLSLILTNATARQLSDWEKVQQAKELKEMLTEYKKALQEENKDKPKEERERMGRIRDIVAQMLNTSTTQVGRMEAIDNNLSTEFKQEMEKGNINISTAHELSRKTEEEQAKAYEQYQEKGELHLKDVKEEQKPEITDEQIEQVQQAIVIAIKGPANRDIFKAKENVAGIEKQLRKHFATTFTGAKFKAEDGKENIYRFAAEGLTIIDSEWNNFLIEYSDLAEIVALMIENGILQYDDTPEEPEEETQEETESGFMNEPTEEETDTAAVETDTETELPGQQNMSNYPGYVPEVQEKGLDFTTWIKEKYGIAQYTLIGNEVRAVISSELEANKDKPLCPAEWEERLTNAISVWVMGKTKEYKKYLES
jgi:ParB family chromosome partitioning protein